jgi:hypothetical protein
MKIKIEINCDNAAFTDDFSGEVSRILSMFSEIQAPRIEVGNEDYSGKLFDSNGNVCGKFYVEG